MTRTVCWRIVSLTRPPHYGDGIFKVPADSGAEDEKTYTFDPSLTPTTMKPILNYDDPRFTYPAFAQGVDPLPSPVLSPDGTRLLLSTQQMWTARRNMNLPPRITQVGSQGIVDSTARVFISPSQGLPTTITVSATDPDPDSLYCDAFFLADGMTFNPSNCTLSWTPSAPVGTKFYVKLQFRTRSGGTDAVIAVLTVASTAPQSRVVMTAAGKEPDGPNPTSGRFALTAPLVPRAIASLFIFDLAGRRIARVNGPSGTQLVWNGRDRAGLTVQPGIYLYRMEVGQRRLEGKVVVVR